MHKFGNEEWLHEFDIFTPQNLHEFAGGSDGGPSVTSRSQFCNDTNHLLLPKGRLTTKNSEDMQPSGQAEPAEAAAPARQLLAAWEIDMHKDLLTDAES